MPIFAARRLAEAINRDEGDVQAVLDAMVESARHPLREHGSTCFELGEGHYLILCREETVAGAPAEEAEEEEEEHGEESPEEFW